MELFTVYHHNTEKVGPDSPLSFDQLASDYADVFTRTGCLEGKYNLVLDDNVKPVVHVHRRVPLTLRVKLEDELRRLTELTIRTHVIKPTSWVSNLVVVQHGSKLRLCIDPRHLGEAVQRSH